VDWTLCNAVESKPGKLGGVWCFKGSRVPVAFLFEHLDRGATVDEFVEWFPSVSPGQVHDVLAFAKGTLDQTAAVA